MHWMINLIAINTLLALLPASLALLANCWRRPAIAHVLWLLVIVKLLLPPMWQVPVLPAEAGQPAAAQPAPPTLIAEHFQPTTPAAMTPAARRPASPEFPIAAQISTTQPAARAHPPSTITWEAVVAPIWLAGAAAVALLATVRLVRFRRSLAACLKESSALEEETKEMAARLGLRRLPAARLGPAGLSPMIWFFGGSALVIVPETMMAALSRDQRAAILAHEIAHLKRHDHWIRLFELGATILLWWHPLLWLARSGLRTAEEHACDALVVRTLGDPPHTQRPSSKQSICPEPLRRLT